MKCISCSTEFEARRSTAKYCSGACRINAMRNAKGEVCNAKTEDVTLKVGGSVVSVTKQEILEGSSASRGAIAPLYTSQRNSEVSVTDNVLDKSRGPVMLSNNPEEALKQAKEFVPTYTGHCGHTSKLPICICYPCFNRGVTHATLGLDKADCETKLRGVYNPATGEYSKFRSVTSMA